MDPHARIRPVPNAAETRIPRMRLSGHLLLWLALLVLLLAAPAVAAPFPSTIDVPTGFQPEGIAVGPGTAFYTGSLANGAIYKGDLRTGAGEVISDPSVGRVSVGMKVDVRSHLLFVAGGPTGMAYVYDARTGDDVAEFTLSAGGAFINDVVITRDAAYFTNSFEAVLYRLPLLPGGRLAVSAEVTALELGGDFEQVPGFNANGIAATPNGKSLIVVNSSLGTLYKIDPMTGTAALIDLGEDTVPFGDGILLEGRMLYVVQNQLDQISVVRLSPDLSSGTVVDVITNDAFVVPATIARFGSALYAVNAHFGDPDPADIDYEVVRVPLR